LVIIKSTAELDELVQASDKVKITFLLHFLFSEILDILSSMPIRKSTEPLLTAIIPSFTGFSISYSVLIQIMQETR
jgi:hypothetical protein